jgi:hypothetical protein
MYKSLGRFMQRATRSAALIEKAGTGKAFRGVGWLSKAPQASRLTTKAKAREERAARKEQRALVRAAAHKERLAAFKKQREAQRAAAPNPPAKDRSRGRSWGRRRRT